MRVLFTTQAAPGHFHPLAPLAQALVAAGHEVRFASSRSFCPDIAASGFTAILAGLDWLESEFRATFPHVTGIGGARRKAPAMGKGSE